MAFGQFPNLRFRPTIGVAQIAQMLAQAPMRASQLATDEARRKAMAEQQRRAKFNQFLNTISTTAGVAQVAQGMAQKQAMAQAGTELGSALAGQVPGALPQGAQGPLPKGVFEQQQAVRQASQVAPRQAAGVALGMQFPDAAGVRRQGGGRDNLGTVANIYGALVRQRETAIPNTPEYDAITKNINFYGKLLGGRVGVPFEQIPIPEKKAPAPPKPTLGEAVREKAGGFVDKAKGLFGGGQEPPPQQPQTTRAGIMSPPPGQPQAQVPQDVQSFLLEKNIGTVIEDEKGARWKKTTRGIVRVK